MSLAIKKLSKKDYDRAQIMYFSGRTVEDICMTYSLDPDTIRFYVFGEDGTGECKTSWYSIKKQMNPTAMAIYMKDKVHVLDQTAGVAFEILSMSLDRLRKQLIDDPEYRLDIDSMGKLSTIHLNLDKVARLETGKATEILDHMGISIAEAKEIINSDPFLVAESEEINNAGEIPWLNDEVEIE